MKVYITKYALTQGIIEEDATLVAGYSTMISVKREHGSMSFFHKGEWYPTRAEAVTRARGLSVKKIHSLRKQIAKLTNMIFA